MEMPSENSKKGLGYEKDLPSTTFIFKSGAGFTITELLVVIAVIILMTGLILPNWRSGEQSLALDRVVHKAGQDVRRAQELSLRAQAFDNCPQDTSITGYGIVFDTSWSSTQYRLFANCKSDGSADDYTFGSNDMVLSEGTITLENGIEIALVSPTPQASIVFIPPTPQVFINGDQGENAHISFQRTDGEGSPKTLNITRKGVIDVN